MLTGKLVRVRVVRNKVTPLYIPATDRQWLNFAQQLCFAFEQAQGKTRGELEELIGEFTTAGPGQLIEQGLAKLLEDRCEFETFADSPPEVVRETVFRFSTQEHTRAGITQTDFNRSAVLNAAAEELQLTPELVERSLFADLRDQQRIETYAPISPQALLHRYNVALAQALLLRAVRMEVRVANESAARFRQLFRAVKFHRLIAKILPGSGASYKLLLEGPLSLFTSTQKYGLQLALFLPTLLHCKSFELTAELLWGAEKKEKTFTLSRADGLVSHLADFGLYTPPEIQHLQANIREQISNWTLIDDPAPQLLGDTIWVPDFSLKHNVSGKIVHVEVLGFWRKVDLETQLRRLKQSLPGQFVLVVSEQYRADESGGWPGDDSVYRFKRTPLATEVAKIASYVAGVF